MPFQPWVTYPRFFFNFLLTGRKCFVQRFSFLWGDDTPGHLPRKDQTLARVADSWLIFAENVFAFSAKDSFLQVLLRVQNYPLRRVRISTTTCISPVRCSSFWRNVCPHTLWHCEKASVRARVHRTGLSQSLHGLDPSSDAADSKQNKNTVTFASSHCFEVLFQANMKFNQKDLQFSLLTGFTFSTLYWPKEEEEKG